MKKLLSILLSVCLILTALIIIPITADSAQADYAVTGESGETGDCTWSLEGTKLTISGSGAMADYQYDVPWGKDITEVVIEDGVTAIGARAFFMCDKLTSISIPASVRSIGEDALYCCYALESADIPEGVQSIGSYAFYGCRAMKSFAIPASVTSIGTSAFASCGALESLSVAEGNTVYDSRNNCNAIIETDTDTLVIGSGVTVIPDSVVSIGTQAFSVCDSLTEITIPASVTSIGEAAFYSCSNLGEIIFMGNVESIGNGAFESCGSLNGVTLPEGLTEIGARVFAYCLNLTIVWLSDSIESISGSAFIGCSSLAEIRISAGVTEIESGAFYYCNNLRSVFIPSSVKTIGKQAVGYYYYNSNVVKIDELTIYGYKNTEAERYANDNGFTFKQPSESPDGYELPSGSYYLTGSFNNWNRADANAMFYAHTSNDGTEEYKLTIALGKDDEFKVISSKGDWYPGGSANNNSVSEDGLYNIYFRPNYDGHGDWFNKVMYVSRAGDIPTEAPTSPATEPATQPATSAPTEPATSAPTQPVVLPTDNSGYLLGDADSDNEVTILDATTIQRKLAGYTLTAFDSAAADSDEDGELTILDATAIQRFLVSLPTHIGIGQRR